MRADVLKLHIIQATQVVSTLSEHSRKRIAMTKTSEPNVFYILPKIEYINRHQALPKQHSTCNHVKNYPSDLWHFGSSQSQQGRSQSPRLHGFTRMFHLVIGANLSWQNKNHGHFFSVLYCSFPVISSIRFL